MAKSNRTHSFDIELASIIGIEKAIIVFNVDFWCTENELKGNPEYLYYGSYWTRESLTSLARKYPYMKRGSISRWVNELSMSGWIKMIQTKEGNIYQRGEKFKRWNAGLPIELTVSQNETVNEVSQNETVAMSQNETQGGVSKWDTNNIELINIELINIDLPANAAEPEKENPNITLKAKKEKKDTPAPRAAKIRTGRKDHTFTQTFELLKAKNAYAHTFFLNNPDIWDSVMRYRIEINSKFASAESEAIAMVKFWKDCNGRRENAEAMIEKTVSAGYKGFFPVENKQQTTRPQTGHPNGVNPYTY